VTEPIDLQPRRVSYTIPLSRPLVTWVLLGIIAVAFVGETLAGGSTNTGVLTRLGAKDTILIADGQYWRLFTSMFLHIGLAHLLFNGYALVIIGIELERLYGPGRFLAVYVLSGLLGSLASYAFVPGLAAGASGAIFGLIGALAAFFLLHRERLGRWGRTRLANIVFLIAINLFFGFTQPGIDNLAHLGGLVSGLGLGWALAPRYQLDPVSLKALDRNQLRRYWPALLLAIVLLVGGTALVTSIQRNSPRGHLLRAQEAIDREEWSVAASELEQALAQDPEGADASLYFYLGLARNYLEQPELAVAAYQSALELDPVDTPSHWNLALTYLQLNRYTEAQSEFRTYLELKPDAADEVQPYLDELRHLAP
jgi:rhomboid protease GluP